jgi:outer membrane protein
MTRTRHLCKTAVITAMLAATFVARPATGQVASPDQPGNADQADSWNFGVGAGVVNTPRYPGSSAHKTRALPLLSASYGRYFIGGLPGAGVPAGLGINLVDRSDWKFGVGLGFDLGDPRKESDDVHLKGLGDVKGTPHGTVFGSYSQDWFKVRGNIVTDIGGRHEGTQASLDVEGKYRLSPALALSAGPGITWSDKKYTQTFFGIDQTQSLNSGLAPYAAGAGLNLLRFSVGAEYAISRSWFVGARASLGTLRGDARNSPITESKSQNTFGLFGVYHF